MRLNIRTTAWLALLLAALVAGTAVADDRDFLRQLAAPPNLIFILDSSRSMVGSPEEPGKVMNARVAYGMVPGGGDDPYSRMGIAKRVLREFLTDVTDANYVLAGYAQAPPADGSSPIPTKHWVYEGIGIWDSTLGAYRADRFHLMELGYAYRFGYGETYAGLLLDNPADIYQGTMMGYTPYFDPALGAAGVENRFGPVRAYDFDPTLPYDLMPIYFGNCIYDDVNDEYLCGDGVFPFFDTGERDASGNKITEDWYYGDGDVFPRCVPWKTANPPLAPDDGCKAAWEDNTGTVPGYGRNRVEFRRRVRLEIPATNPNTGLANHPLGVLDSDGMSVGNELVNDLGTEDYDLDGSPDRDYDEDMAYDWVLYVDAVEQLSMRACGSPQMPPTPTPTPLPLDCADLYISNPLQRGLDNRPQDVGTINMDVGNNTPYTAYLTQTTITWADTQSQPGNPYIDRMFFEGNCWNNYWQGDEYGSPATVVPPYAAGGGGICGDANTSFNRGDNRTDWFAYLNSGEAWVGNVCVQLDFYFPDDPATQTCVVNDCVNLSLTPPTATPTPRDTNTPTNTPTPTITLTPSNTPIPPTPTNTFTPAPPTNTFTPAPPTNTPRDTNTPTNTPIPPTRTNTSPPTNTPTKTPIPPTPTNTPTPTPEIE